MYELQPRPEKAFCDCCGDWMHPIERESGTGDLCVECRSCIELNED